MSQESRTSLIESGRHDRDVKMRMTCGGKAPVFFFSQASTMFDSGVPILRILDVLADQTEDARFAEVTWDLAQSLHNGVEFSRALADFPRIFPRPLVALIAAGERTGQLAFAMRLAYRWLQRGRDLRAKLISALTYPCLVVAFALLGGFCICVTLLPQLLGAVSSLGGEIHWTTKFLMEGSALASNPAAWLVVFAVAGLMFARISTYTETGTGRLRFSTIMREIPLLGLLYRSMGLSQFLLTLGATLEVGLDIIKSLKLAARSSGDAVLELHTEHVVDAIKNGEGLSVSMQMNPSSFPNVVTSLVMVGEESGNLVEVLPILSTLYEEETGHLIDMLMVALEPIMLGLMALVVVFCAIGFLMPLQGLLANLG